MKSVYRPEIKIVTAEDPIEYVCPSFCQHEVDERVGNTFAQYVRSFMRHDPEVIMIGEIRDSQTAELAFRAAQTGHLVLSTLHTNDALGAVTRLKDLGVDNTVCTSSLLAVLAQRLVRQICWNCKQEYTPEHGVLERAFDVRAERHRLVPRGRLRHLPSDRLQAPGRHHGAVDAGSRRCPPDQPGRAVRGDRPVGAKEHVLDGDRRPRQAARGAHDPR